MENTIDHDLVHVTAPIQLISPPPAFNLATKKLGILPRRTTVWIEDDSVVECYQCHTKFGWLSFLALPLRRHHCRGCGRIFCDACSKSNIMTSTLKPSGLIDPYQYLSDCLKQTPNLIKQRSCHECQLVFSKIKELSSVVSVLELLPLEITDYEMLRRISHLWEDACNIVLSKFREIQFNLPNHRFNRFEKHILQNNVHLMIGHNILIGQFIKSIDWFKLSSIDLEYYLSLIVSSQQTCECWSLMCCRECQPHLTDTEVIDILLYVSHPRVREVVIQFLTKDLTLLMAYLPILTYVIRLDEDSYRKNVKYHDVREYLINLSLESKAICYQFFWEILVQLEEPHYNWVYRETSQLLLQAIEMKLGIDAYNDVINGMKLVNTFSQLSVNLSTIESTEVSINETLTSQMISSQIYEKLIPLPINPDLVLCGLDYDKIKIMKSATKPVYIPCQVIKNVIVDQLETSPTPLIDSPLESELYAFIYKSEDVRKDRIIMGLIRIMDILLKQQGLDLNIVTYNVLPTALNSGLIEIVPNAETLYYIKEKKKYSIQNYMFENNGQSKIDDLRGRFIRSTAGYCVITYLLGAGDRHLDNIMVTTDGRLFHIDYSFMMGFDPKPMAPKMRITTEMEDALGGVGSVSYKQFEELCSQCYNILRKHTNLFTNLLFLLTKIDHNRFTVEQLEIEIGKRFLPGEFNSQAKGQLLKTINSSHSTSSTLIDFIHYHYKENNLNLYERAGSLMSYITLNQFNKKSSPQSTLSSPFSKGAQIALPILK